jgi:hypothetical protein
MINISYDIIYTRNGITMDDLEIEKILLSSKFISKDDVEYIRFQVIENKSTFYEVVGKLKKLSLVILILKAILFFVGIDIFINEDLTSAWSYFFAAVLGFVIMDVIAPFMLGAKLFFISFKKM